MKFFSKLAQLFHSQTRPAASRRAKLQVENLESRLVPYSVSGNSWTHPELVTLSFVPDGTDVGGVTSNLQSTFDNHVNSSFRAGWRNQILKAAQAWAQQTNLNFAVVNDNGAAIGSGSYQQGDAGFGDIRIGGFQFGTDGLAQAYLPPQINNYSVAGDFQFNTGQTFNLGSTYDLFTVAAHEFGHTLGLNHGSLGAVMQATYPGTKTALASDDITGIRSLYSSSTARSADSYDALLSNGTAVTATDITTQINPTDLTALLPNLDITTTADLDYYRFLAPLGSNGTMVVRIQSSGLSLLAPQVQVYNAALAQIGTATGLNQYGTTLDVTITGVTPGQLFYVKVDGADNTAFGTGKYALALNFGSNATPTASSPNTQTANGTPLSGGGAEASHIDFESRLNQTTAGVQDAETAQAVGMDVNHNTVVTWSSFGQDGSGYGVYARRFHDGAALTNEFRVNTTTAGDQRYAAVAMNDAGDFVVTWSSYTAATGWDVYAQRYNAAGIAQGGEFQVNTTTASDQIYSRVMLDNAGNFVITWAGDSQSTEWDVYARRYDALGLAQGDEFRVNTTTTNDQRSPAIAGDFAGNFVIIWSSFGQDGNAWGVYGRRYTSLGVPLDEPFRINITTINSQKEAAVAMDAVGNFVVTWASNKQDGSGWGIFGRRYDALGVAQTGEFLVNTTTVNDQVQAAIAMDAAGNFIISWSSWLQDGSGWGVYAQQFDSVNTALGDEFHVTTTTTGDQKRPSIAMKTDALGHRHAAIVWSGNGIGDTYGVFGQMFEC